MGVHENMTLEEAEQLFGFIAGTPYDEAVVKATYRSLTKTYHPDAVRTRGGDVDAATEHMGKINAAKDILEDATKDGRTITAGKAAAPNSGTNVDDAAFWDWVSNMSERHDERMKAEAEQRAAEAAARANAAAERTAESAQQKQFWAEMRRTPFKVINAGGVPVNSIWDAAEEQRARKIVSERLGNRSEYAANVGNAASAATPNENKKTNSGAPAWYRFVKWIIDHVPYRLVFFYRALMALAATGDANSWAFPNMQLVYLIFFASLVNLVLPFVTKPIQKLLQKIWRGIGSALGIA